MEDKEHMSDTITQEIMEQMHERLHGFYLDGLTPAHTFAMIRI